MACKAALAVLEILNKEGLIQKAESLGGTIASRFKELQEKHELIGEVRGLGPMLALELVKDRQSKEPAAEETKKLVQLCFEKGLIVLSCGNYGNVIRTLMPLVITDEQLDKGISILDESLEELRK